MESRKDESKADKTERDWFYDRLSVAKEEKQSSEARDDEDGERKKRKKRNTTGGRGDEGGESAALRWQQAGAFLFGLAAAGADAGVDAARPHKGRSHSPF